MTLTSWLKYDHEIKKMIIYVNVMLICVNNIDKKYLKQILIYVNFMIIYVNMIIYADVMLRRTNI